MKLEQLLAEGQSRSRRHCGSENAAWKLRGIQRSPDFPLLRRSGTIEKCGLERILWNHHGQTRSSP